MCPSEHDIPIEEEEVSEEEIKKVEDGLEKQAKDLEDSKKQVIPEEEDLEGVDTVEEIPDGQESKYGI